MPFTLPRPLATRLILVPIVLVAFAWAVPSRAFCPTGGDHDLVLAGLDVPAVIAQCPQQLGAWIQVEGDDDHLCTSTATAPAAEIRFSWADGDQPAPPTGAPGQWQSIGTLPVLWSQGLFAKGSTWPEDFTVAKSSLQWLVPQSPKSVHLRAEVTLLGGAVDAAPVNNVVVVESVDNTLSPVCHTTSFGTLCLSPCPLEKENWGDFDTEHLIQLRTARPAQPAGSSAAPSAAHPGARSTATVAGWRSPGPLCELVDCPPCLAAGSCDGVTLLVGPAARTATVRLLAGGEKAAEAVPLPQAIRRAGRDFAQLVHFRPQPGVTYALELETASDGESFALPLLLLTDAGSGE